MKHLKRFIILAILLTAVGLISLLRIGEPDTTLAGHASAALESYYHEIEADDINSRQILLYIDGSQPDMVEPSDLFMSDELALLAPADTINDIFHCSMSVLSGGRYLFGKDTASCLIDTVEGSYQIGEEWQDGPVSAKDEQGRLLVSLPLLADCFGYDYRWEDAENAAYLAAPVAGPSVVPEAYDLRDEGRVSEVRDQGSWGTCWAFASLGALESSLLPERSMTFSADHLVRTNGFNMSPGDGGDYNIALAYLTSWRGPVSESEDPYGDGYAAEDLTAEVHLQEARILGNQDLTEIKHLLMAYGAVQSAIYSQPDISQLSDYYEEDTAAYYCPEEEICNHDITIIGWDDHYSRDNFKIRPERDGAFICKNSWGQGFGIDGFFYISYEDPNIGRHGIVYTRVDDVDNYRTVCQSDLLGWTGSIGYNEPGAWFSAVYSSEQESKLSALGFYATGPGTAYDIYMVHDFEETGDMERRELIQSGYFDEQGYYTVDLESPPVVEQGERFAVVIHIWTKDSVHPVAVEYAANELTETADISDGESYMSYNAGTWSRMETSTQCNACLKVYLD